MSLLMSPWKTKIEYNGPAKAYSLLIPGIHETSVKNLPTKLEAEAYRLNVEAPALAHLVARLLTVAPNHLPRLLRAAELAKAPGGVIPNGAPDTYYVHGSSGSRLYRVHIPANDPDGWTCTINSDPDSPASVGHTCPDLDNPKAPLTLKGRKRCKHMAAAWMKANYPAVDQPDNWQIVANAERADKIELRAQIEADRERLEQALLATHPMYALSKMAKQAAKAAEPTPKPAARTKQPSTAARAG